MDGRIRQSGATLPSLERSGLNNIFQFIRFWWGCSDKYVVMMFKLSQALGG